MAGKPKANEKAPSAQEAYADILANLRARQGGGKFFFPKPGKTRLRLIATPNNLFSFYREVVNQFGKTRYMVLGVVLSTEDSTQKADPTKVVGVVVTNGVITEITGYLAEGFDLFGEKTAHGISITRIGSGFDTQYSVSPSPQPIPLEIELPMENLLDELAEAYTNSQADNASSQDEEEIAGSAAEKKPAW